MNASRQRPNAGAELPPARAADPPKVSQVPKGRGRKPEIAGKDEDSIEEGRAYPSLCNYKLLFTLTHELWAAFIYLGVDCALSNHVRVEPSKPSSKSGRHHRSEEDIDDEEYARRLHVALNKGSRDIPADANFVSIDDSSDDESGGGDSMDMDAPVDPSPAGSPAPVIPPNDGSVLPSTGVANPVLDSNMGGTHISSRVSLINSASSGGTENASSDVVGAPSEDADERWN
ncbi:hypothetical protein EJB05_49177, partial [Eragrostis curvula]